MDTLDGLCAGFATLGAAVTIAFSTLVLVWQILRLVIGNLGDGGDRDGD